MLAPAPYDHHPLPRPTLDDNSSWTLSRGRGKDEARAGSSPLGNWAMPSRWEEMVFSWNGSHWMASELHSSSEILGFCHLVELIAQAGAELQNTLKEQKWGSSGLPGVV